MPMGIDGASGELSGGGQSGTDQLASAGICGWNEELFMGVCYARCSALTNGSYKKRIAPNGCCKEFSLKCMVGSEVDFAGVFPGSGYKRGGSLGESPHPPGLCDGNEELHAGMCFMKCSVL